MGGLRGRHGCCIYFCYQSGAANAEADLFNEEGLPMQNAAGVFSVDGADRHCTLRLPVTASRRVAMFVIAARKASCR